MGAFLERIGLFARSPDARPLAEIAADIDAELEFHVAESARALEREGLAPELARAEALKRFGDYGRIRRECARTQMGERIMLQRIQLVLTAVLVAAVGVLAWSNQQAQVQARAAMDAERQRSDALLSRLEAQLALISPHAPAANLGALDAPSVVDRKPVAAAPVIDRKPAPSASVALAEPTYLGPDGRAVGFEDAMIGWNLQFGEQPQAWRHGLKIADRLAALPGTQGVEILAHVWRGLSVEHREQAMKPFVRGVGHPHALEVLSLGIAPNQEASVRERASRYLERYAWRGLSLANGEAERWIAEWRDKPVADVLRANSESWASELGLLIEAYASLDMERATQLLSVVDQVDLSMYGSSGVDLAAILRGRGVDAISEAQVASLPSLSDRERARKVRSWCAR